MVFNLKNIYVYLKLSLFQTFLFVTVYGLTNYLCEHHFYQFRFNLPIELGIPFLPAMILAYFSLNILMLLPMFLLNEKELYGMNKVMTIVTLVAGLIFVLLPAPCGFTRTAVEGSFAPLFKNLYQLDKTGNTFPSLHITYSFMMCRIFVLKNSRQFAFFWSWFTLIALSVLFTHQHHIADILGGMILAEYGVRKFYLT